MNKNPVNPVHPVKKVPPRRLSSRQVGFCLGTCFDGGLETILPHFSAGYYGVRQLLLTHAVTGVTALQRGYPSRTGTGRVEAPLA